jgi:hypothetical protein
MKLSWVLKFQMKSIYIHQMVSSQKGDAKELRRARRRRVEVEVRVKINENVENAIKLRIMTHAIAQTMLLADIFNTRNVFVL